MSTVSSPLAFLDHSLLAPTVTHAELERACQIALEFQVAALCIIPSFVPEAAQRLQGSSVRVCTVIGFPFGYQSTHTKRREVEVALDEGAVELDIVVHVSRVLSGDWQPVEEEIAQLTSLIHARKAQVKWIFETAALSVEQKIRLCAICADAGVDWVKTSTGFGPGGATPEDVALLRKHSPASVQVKASGGIRTLAEVQNYLALGATRIGTSRTELLSAEWRAQQSSSA